MAVEGSFGCEKGENWTGFSGGWVNFEWCFSMVGLISVRVEGSFGCKKGGDRANFSGGWRVVVVI